ncbi:MAG: hypothetical protein O7F76_04765 [Planctomycetota bacterium]|nr:hypothetical protein [Planctomycetota bacterium]
MNDVVNVDIGHGFVDLCKWDGRSIEVEKAAVPAGLEPAAWIERMSPRAGFDLVVRSTRLPSGAAADIASSSRVCGARSCRVVPADCAADPGAAAARHAADRNRLGKICSVEIGAAEVRVGLIDRRGRCLSSKTIRIPDRASGSNARVDPLFVASAIRQVMNASGEGVLPSDTEAIPIVCFGGAGPAVATMLADACNTRTVLIPVYAGTLACVGLLLADIVLDLREEVEPRPLDLSRLRRQFAGMMDSAATAVTRQGYDIDDTVCSRFVELGIAGQVEAVEMEVESLSIADAILQRFSESGLGDSGQTPEVRAIRVGATIATSKPALPLPVLPSARRSVEQSSEDSLGAHMETRVDRRELAAGSVAVGPATITERHTETRVGSGWRADVQPSGDILMGRES